VQQGQNLVVTPDSVASRTRYGENLLSVAEKMIMLRSMFLHFIHFPFVSYFIN